MFSLEAITLTRNLLEIYLKLTLCFLRLMGDEDSLSSSSITSDLRAILDAQKNVILSAINTQIQGLQNNLLKAQTDLAPQIASEGQRETSGAHHMELPSPFIS